MKLGEWMIIYLVPSPRLIYKASLYIHYILKTHSGYFRVYLWWLEGEYDKREVVVWRDWNDDDAAADVTFSTYFGLIWKHKSVGNGKENMDDSSQSTLIRASWTALYIYGNDASYLYSNQRGNLEGNVIKWEKLLFINSASKYVHH